MCHVEVAVAVGGWAGAAGRRPRAVSLFRQARRFILRDGATWMTLTTLFVCRRN